MSEFETGEDYKQSQEYLDAVAKDDQLKDFEAALLEAATAYAHSKALNPTKTNQLKALQAYLADQRDKQTETIYKISGGRTLKPISMLKAEGKWNIPTVK